MDDLEAILGGELQPIGDDAPRRSLLRQTLQVVRRRRRMRQLRWALAVAAGLAIAFFALRQLVGTPAPVLVEQTPEKSVPLPAAIPTPTANLSAPALERLGETSRREQQAGLYRQAGDRFLTEDTDVEAALRCYTQALDAGTSRDLEVSTTDSWLLMAIKLDRRKEKTDDN